LVTGTVLSIAMLQAATQPLPDMRDQPPAQQDAAVARAPISRETAERRLDAILDSGIANRETVALLRELAERVDDPELAPLIRYNAGVIAMRTDSPESRSDAQELFREADRDATDPALRASARYNLAHTIIDAADSQSPPEQLESIADIDARIAAYRRAERAFRSTLDADPTHTQTAKNTERLRRRIQELRDKRDLLDQQQQTLDELADQLDELAEQQQRQADQNRARSRQNEENPEQADQDARQQQQGLSEQTEQAAQESRQARSPEETESAMQQARQAQSRAEQQLGQGQTDQASESQSEAAEQLRQAAQEARDAARQARGQQAQPGGDPQQGQQQPPSELDQPSENRDQTAQQPGQTEAPEPPEVDPIAEALIDKERRERAERMRYLQRTGRQRVERDW